MTGSEINIGRYFLINSRTNITDKMRCKRYDLSIDLIGTRSRGAPSVGS